MALYPGPMGVTESLLALEQWPELQMRNPVLSEMEPVVESLLVSRVHGARDHWRVSMDI